MNFFRASRYLKYLFFSGHKKGHGIHSPFIFDLVSRVFRNKIDPSLVFKIESIRKNMLSDNRIVIVSDPGSGSEKYKSNTGKVSDIARISSVPLKYSVLLSNMAAEFGRENIIESGTSFGISAMYMAGSRPEAFLYTMEGSPSIAEIAVQNFNKSGFSNIKILTGSFDDLLPGIIETGIKPGLVFIHCNHRKEPLLSYFSNISHISDNDTVIIIDGIYNSKEMEEAWNEIKRFEKVSVTIDIFRMGIVFFREGINHNHYIIRY
jgi:predicted O-methyltransferase YrrM